MQAIKDMPNLCRDSQIKTLPKIADVLTQLLQVNLSALQIWTFCYTLNCLSQASSKHFTFQSEDRGEISVIESSLMTLIRRDTKAAIIGIFSQVFLHRELCVNFYSLN